MIPFLLGLHLKVVGKAGQTNAFEVVCKVQIQISGVELLVDLLVEQVGYMGVHHSGTSLQMGCD